HLRFAAPLDAADYCAILKNWEFFLRNKTWYGHEGKSLSLRLGRIAPEPSDRGNAATEPDNEQEAVFVEVVKFVEFPERVVPSLVRLDRVNDSYRLRRDSLYFSARIAGFVIGSRFADGKAGEIVGRIPVGFNQLPSQVVKTAPQLIQDFPAQQGDRVGDRG